VAPILLLVLLKSNLVETRQTFLDQKEGSAIKTSVVRMSHLLNALYSEANKPGLENCNTWKRMSGMVEKIPKSKHVSHRTALHWAGSYTFKQSPTHGLSVVRIVSRNSSTVNDHATVSNAMEAKTSVVRQVNSSK